MKAFLKGLAKITAALKAQAKGDLGNGESGVTQVESCLFQAIDQKVFFKGDSKGLFE